MNQSRKRRRYDDDNYSGVQMKYFVNQQLMEKSDKTLLNQVFEKTLNKIFAGAKLNQGQSPQNKLCDNKSSSPELDSIDDKLPDLKNSPTGCKLCWKDVEITTNYVCKNCNLKMCSNCHTNCFSCHAVLCNNCVMLFGCCLGEDPICEDCKQFM